MTIRSIPRSRSLFAMASVMLILSAPAFAQEQGAPAKDPSRWYQPDTTPKQRAANMRKEAQAAYQEAVKACREGDKGERKACMKEAKDNLNEELSAARDETKK